MTNLEKVGEAISQLDSKLRLDAILAAIRLVPSVSQRQDLERRYWDAIWEGDGEAAEVYVGLGGIIGIEDQCVDRAALQGIEAELARLIPGYKPQIQ